MILATANRLPPFICRLHARKKNGLKAMSHADIAKASGLSRSRVASLSSERRWDHIAIKTADAFARACGVDLTRPASVLRWFRAAGMAHVRGGNAQQRRFFHRLMS